MEKEYSYSMNVEGYLCLKKNFENESLNIVMESPKKGYGSIATIQNEEGKKVGEFYPAKDPAAFELKTKNKGLIQIIENSQEEIEKFK